MPEAETGQVAADLTSLILQEAVKNGDENAARLLAETGAGETDVAPQAARPTASSPAPAAQAATEPDDEATEEIETPPALPDFTPNISDDLAAILDEPDHDEEAAAEIAAERADVGYDPDFDEDTARSDRAKDKKIKYLEERLAAEGRGKWVAENLRAYPLLATYAADELRTELAGATSRRAAARAARALHDRYAAALKPALQDLAAAKAAAKTQADAEARAKAKAEWGVTITEPAGAGSVERNAELARAREAHAPLEERIKILAGLTTT